jgi:hypothetical protein
MTLIQKNLNAHLGLSKGNNYMTNDEIFKTKGYCIVRNAISEELRDFVTQYSLFDEMQDFQIEEGKPQVPGAHSKYGNPAMETMLLHLHKTMEQNTGLKLYPTYSYYRVYRNGNDLKIHKDRPSCEISATLCFNYSYDDTKYTWPIFMEGHRADLKPGDMIIYRGCDLEHWRDTFDYFEDAWHVQGFFHYVDADGPYSDFKYDKRETIGQLDTNYKKQIYNLPSKKYIQYT